MRPLLALTLCGALSACTVATPLTGADGISAEALKARGIDTVIVSLTEAEIQDDDMSADLFWYYTHKINAELEDQDGLIASSKRVEIFGDKAWTMTIWEDPASLQAFVRSDTHRAAADKAYEMIRRGRFATFALPVEQMPLNWQMAKVKLATEGREMALKGTENPPKAEE